MSGYAIACLGESYPDVTSEHVSYATVVIGSCRLFPYTEAKADEIGLRSTERGVRSAGRVVVSEDLVVYGL